MGVMELRRRILSDAPYIKTASGAVASFRTDLAIPLKSLKVGFMPKQDGSGDPSPSNVRNMIAWTGFSVWKTGKNMYPLSAIVTGANAYSVSGDLLTVTGNDGGGYPERTGQYLKAGDYTVFRSVPYGQVRYKQDATSETVIAAHNVATKKFTLAYDGITKVKVGNGNQQSYPYTTTFMIEYGGTATTYESYNGTTIPVSWTGAGDIWGGYLDLVSGELFSTYNVVDLSTLSFANYSTNNLAYNPGFFTNYNSAGAEGMLCDKLISAGDVGNSWNSQAHLTVMKLGTRDSLFLRYITSGLTGNEYQAEVNNFMSTNKPKLYFESATPTYVTTLTPQQISALRGVNNIWSDTNGSVSVEYWAH